MAGRIKKEKTLSIEEKLKQAMLPEAEHLFKLPKKWCWTKLGRITDVVGGGTPSSSHAEYYEKGKIPWISPADLSGYDDIYISHGAKFITQLGLEKSSTKLLPRNTVCLSSRAPIGYVAIAQNKLCTNQGFKSFLPSPIYMPRYLYWYLKGNKELLESKASGTTFLELSGRKAAETEFPLPPLPEQQRIVDRIESLFAKLDEAKEKAQAVVDGFEDRKAAILHKAFTGELTEGWRTTKGVLLSSWQNKRIADFADVKGGKRLPKGCVLTTEKTKHPYLRIADFGGDTIDLSDIHFITDDVYQQISRYIIETGDVYISIVGTIGKCGTIPEELDGANLTENAARIITKITLPRYLVGYLSSPIAQEDILGRIRSATLGKLSLTNIKNIVVPLPTKEEQQEIVNILDVLLKLEVEAKEAAE